VFPMPSPVRKCAIWERGRVSETTTETLQYRFDGLEDAPILALGLSLGTSWHMLWIASYAVHVVHARCISTGQVDVVQERRRCW
jgi:hypothetical protein